MDHHVIKGLFLGYTATHKQIYYLEHGNKKVKIASHAHFDEGMNDLSFSDLPPFAHHICKALGHAVSADEHEITASQDMDIFCSEELFPITFCHPFHILPSDIMNEYDMVGFVLACDDVPPLAFESNWFIYFIYYGWCFCYDTTRNWSHIECFFG